MRLAELALCLTDPARVLAGIFILPLPRQTGPGWVGLQVRRGRKLREGAEPSQGQPAAPSPALPKRRARGPTWPASPATRNSTAKGSTSRGVVITTTLTARVS